MEYFYGAMWLVVAFILIFRMSKESKIFYLLGGFFAFMGIWWLLDAYLKDIDLLSGGYGFILKGVGVVCLVIVGIFYYKNIYKKR